MDIALQLHLDDELATGLVFGLDIKVGFLESLDLGGLVGIEDDQRRDAALAAEAEGGVEERNEDVATLLRAEDLLEGDVGAGIGKIHGELVVVDHQESSGGRTKMPRQGPDDLPENPRRSAEVVSSARLLKCYLQL